MPNRKSNPGRAISRQADNYFSYQFTGGLTLHGEGVMHEMDYQLSVTDERELGSLATGNAWREIKRRNKDKD